MKITKNIYMLEEVAAGLGELLEKVVFVGGATTALYIDDVAAPSPTPSDDVDCVIQIATKSEYDALEAKLREKGFKDPPHDVDVKSPICRKIYKSIKVDVMPTEGEILGFSNIWYKEAIKNKISVTLPSHTEIFIFTVPYFLATKLVAYNDRGKAEDIRGSQDMEDIITILDGCMEIEKKIAGAPESVRDFIKKEFIILLEDEELFEEAAHGFIRQSADPVGRAKQLVLIVRRIAYP